MKIKSKITFASGFPDITTDQMFLDDIQYYWQENGDLENYPSFDLERLKKLDWRVANAWMNYQQAKETLDFNINNI